MRALWTALFLRACRGFGVSGRFVPRGSLGLVLWVLGCGCLGGASSAHAGERVDSVYLFKNGTFVSIEVRAKETYPLRVMLSSKYRLLWIKVRLPQASLHLTPKGYIHLEELDASAGIKVQYDGRGRIASVGKHKLSYRSDGRLSSLGSLSFSYLLDGSVNALGKCKLVYRTDATLQSIGSVKLKYRHEGRLGAIGGIAVKYDPNGRIAGIGGFSVSYSTTQNIVEQLSGSESRLRLRVLWEARSMCDSIHYGKKR